MVNLVLIFLPFFLFFSCLWKLSTIPISSLRILEGKIIILSKGMSMMLSESITPYISCYHWNSCSYHHIVHLLGVKLVTNPIMLLMLLVLLKQIFSLFTTSLVASSPSIESMLLAPLLACMLAPTNQTYTFSGHVWVVWSKHHRWPLYWHHSQNGLCILSKTLDHCLANVKWRLHFPKAFVELLFCLHSDHNPILLCFGGLPLSHGPRPFRFEVAEIDHTDSGCCWACLDVLEQQPDCCFRFGSQNFISQL